MSQLRKPNSSTNPLRVYFMGTGDIAIPVLKALHESDQINLVGVCTQPDRAKGRKKVLTSSPLGAAAEALELAVIDKPVTVNSDTYLAHLTELNPDVVVVIAFGQLLKLPVLELPRLGCINLHASILPLYRGASPINAALLNGDHETGISVMQMEKGLDTGPVACLHKLTIAADDTYASLEVRLATLGAESIVSDLYDIASGAEFIPQNDELATHVGKISKNDGVVDWNKSAEELERISRAYYPWPTLFFHLKTGKRERKISVVSATVLPPVVGANPGDYIQADKDAWIIQCGSGALRLDAITPDGSKTMSGPEFLRGVQL